MNSTVFKPEYFKLINKNELPKSFDKIVLSIDSAVYGKESSDYSAGLLIGQSQTNLYLINCFLVKYDFDELNQFIENYYKNLEYKNVEVIVENKALGPALFSQLKKNIKKVKVKIYEKKLL